MGLLFFRRDFADPMAIHPPAVVAAQVHTHAEAEPAIAADVAELPRFVEPIVLSPTFTVLNVGNRNEFRDKVVALVQKGVRRFVVDLRHTHYVDPSAWGMLITLTKFVRSEGGELTLSHLSDDLSTVVEIAHLDDVLTIVREGER
jgi:anti-anti-sigma factor